MNRSAWAAVIASTALSFAGSVQAAPDAPDGPPPPVTMPALPAGTKTQPVGFSRLVTTIEEGRVWATFDHKFLTCVGPPPLTWTSANKTLDAKLYGAMFFKELKATGFELADDPDNLFKERDESDLKIAGNIKDARANLCLRTKPKITNAGVAGHQYDLDGAIGYVIFDIDWQIYSNSQKKIVLNKEVNTGASLAEHAPGNYPRLIQNGIRENMRALIASDEFRSVVLAPAAKPDLKAVERANLVLAGSLNAKAAKISDAVGSVVLIESGGGHGSGFLVSSDGYVMTAQHVVGADKHVKIRWPDGLERDGEVIRSDKRRDVAIIKTDSRGRPPLALRRETPQPGDTVFAIGAPLDVKFQSTVTRGVASANRILDGFSFIQSDVTISPGNSGGPLLDEKGQVLGICDLTFRPGGRDEPTGINYFVPIRDALDFLSAEQR